MSIQVGKGLINSHEYLRRTTFLPPRRVAYTVMFDVKFIQWRPSSWSNVFFIGQNNYSNSDYWQFDSTYPALVAGVDGIENYHDPSPTGSAGAVGVWHWGAIRRTSATNCEFTWNNNTMSPNTTNVSGDNAETFMGFGSDYPGTSGYSSDMLVSNVKIWDLALTPEQMQVERFMSAPVHLKGLNGWWPMGFGWPKELDASLKNRPWVLESSGSAEAMPLREDKIYTSPYQWYAKKRQPYFSFPYIPVAEEPPAAEKVPSIYVIRPPETPRQVFY